MGKWIANKRANFFQSLIYYEFTLYYGSISVVLLYG